MAMLYGIRVYTIGIGTNGKALTPVAMQADGKIIFDYAPVEIDEALLKEIAKNTGGQYFRATDNKALKNIYEQIDKLEKTKIQVSAQNRKILCLCFIGSYLFVNRNSFALSGGKGNTVIWSEEVNRDL